MEKAIREWFDHVGRAISDSKSTVLGRNMVWPFNVILSGPYLPEAEAQLPGSSSEVPDAVLMSNTLGDYPLLALEVGFYGDP